MASLKNVINAMLRREITSAANFDNALNILNMTKKIENI